MEFGDADKLCNLVNIFEFLVNIILPSLYVHTAKAYGVNFYYNIYHHGDTYFLIDLYKVHPVYCFLYCHFIRCTFWNLDLPV
jgi:hypothetical protein